MKWARLLLAIGFIISLALVGTTSQMASAQSTLPPLCSGFQLQNTNPSSSVTQIFVDFYKVMGGTGNSIYRVQLPDIPPSSSASYYVPSYASFSTVPSGSYSLVISSGAPLNSIVNQRTCSGTPYVVTSYKGLSTSTVSTTVFLPYVLSRAFSQNYSSQITVQNTGTDVTTITLNFFKPGIASAVASFNQTVQKNEAWTVDLSSGTYATAALAGFAGAVEVTSTSQPVAAVVSYGEGAGDNALGYSGVITGSQILYATQVDKYAYAGNYTSGITVYNPNSSSTPIRVDYIRTGQTSPSYSQNITIPANNVYIQYLGSLSGLPNGFNGTAIVTVTSGSNKVFGLFNMSSSSGQADAMTMIPIEDADTTLFMPQILRNAYGGYNSGFQIVNTTSNTVTLSIEFWKLGATSPTVVPATIGPNSVLTQYVGVSTFPQLGDNWNGGVIVHATGGNVLASVNIQAPGSGDTLSQYIAFNNH